MHREKAFAASVNEWKSESHHVHLIRIQSIFRRDCGDNRGLWRQWYFLLCKTSSFELQQHLNKANTDSSANFVTWIACICFLLKFYVRNFFSLFHLLLFFFPVVYITHLNMCLPLSWTRQFLSVPLFGCNVCVSLVSVSSIFGHIFNISRERREKHQIRRNHPISSILVWNFDDRLLC